MNYSCFENSCQARDTMAPECSCEDRVMAKKKLLKSDGKPSDEWHHWCIFEVEWLCRICGPAWCSIRAMLYYPPRMLGIFFFFSAWDDSRFCRKLWASIIEPKARNLPVSSSEKCQVLVLESVLPKTSYFRRVLWIAVLHQRCASLLEMIISCNHDDGVLWNSLKNSFAVVIMIDQNSHVLSSDCGVKFLHRLKV